MFGFKIIRQKQYDDMEDLLSILDTFLFVASTDKPKSSAVIYAKHQMALYERNWKE